MAKEILKEKYSGVKYILFYVFILICSNTVFGQSGDLYIHTSQNEDNISITRNSQHAIQQELENTNWSISKDSITILFDSSTISNPLVLGDFKFNLKSIENIESIKCNILGYSSGEGIIKDLKLYLSDGENSITLNQANKNLKGKRWPKRMDDWTYYFNLESSNFSKLRGNVLNLLLQIENTSNSSVSAVIKDVEIKITYKPRIKVCKDEVITFFVDEPGVGYNYNWSLPDNTLLVSEKSNSHIINLLFQGNDFIEKSLSVEVTKGTETLYGHRFINYYDCRLSEIKGNFWIDKNCNLFFDSLDLGLSSLKLGLYEYDILIGESLTDSLGYFKFDSIISSNYDVRFKLNDDQQIYYINEEYLYGLTKENNIFKSENFELEPGIIYDSLSFGVVESCKLSGYIWEDINGDNIQDTFENSTYSNILVSILSDSDLEKTCLTDSTGNYTFENLSPGNYEICLDIQDDMDVSNSISEKKCKNFTILCGEKSKLVNIGLIKRGQISGKIWLDGNENGLNELNELLLNNVEVYLLDTFENVIDSVLSDTSGYYIFNNLFLGNYQISLNIPNEYGLTDFQIGLNDIDNDFIQNGSNAKSIILNITSGKKISNIDCGFILKKCSLGDFVWLDTNGNGLQDANETGINNIIIQLFSDNGIKVSEIQSKNFTSNEPGYYKFENIPTGKYYIKVLKPDLYKFTDYSQQNLAINSDIQLSTGASKVFELLPGSYFKDIDIGLIYNYGSIESLVWLDNNENGIQDLGDEGLNDIKLSLFNENNDLFGSNYSNGSLLDGNIYFEKIIPGKYYLKLEDLSNEFLLSEFQSGNDRELDSDFNKNDLRSTLFDILPGSSVKNIDLGLKTNFSSIEGIVWNDRNQDGIKNTDEERLDGIQIELYNEDLELISSTTSGLIGQNGKYRFEKLIKSNYFIKFILPQGYVYSEGIGVDMDITGLFGQGTTDLISIDWGVNIEDKDGGLLIKNGRIGDLVWFDKNENGLQDSDEKGVANIIIQLLDTQGNIVEKTTTDLNGIYSFEDIFPKEYFLLFINNGNFEFTKTVLNNDLGSKVIDQDGDGFTNIFELLPNEDKNNMDAGLIFKFASIGDKVWIDSNSNGLYDDLEKGLGGVSLRLFDENDSLISETISDIEGNYRFKNILQGNYYIQIEVPDTLNPPISNGSIFQLSNQNGSNTTSIFNLEAGFDISEADFGLQLKKGIIGDFVWLDANENGLQDLGEKGLNGIEIRLYNFDGAFITDVITKRKFGIDGFYEFKVDPGKYYLEFGLQNIYKTTPGKIGLNKNIDSDVINSNGTTDIITVNSGQIRTDIDAGFSIKKCKVGGRVWFDENSDGIFQVFESGIDNVKIKLYNSDNTLIDSTITETSNISMGSYVFENLNHGAYYLVYEYPDGYVPTIENIGDDDIDSDITGVNGEGSSDVFNLSPGESISNNYGGFVLVPKNFVGDFVWLDTNLNGLQDTDEVGVDDIVVKLFNKDSLLLRSTVTNKDNKTKKTGYYKFTNVPEGEYFIQFIIPIGYLFTKSGMGDNDSLDNDVTSVYGNTDIFSIDENSGISNIDAGLKYDRNSSIGDFVWEDMNGNGLQDNNELGVNGVIIRLYKEGNGFIRSTVSKTHTKTGKKGYYLFDNLSSGRYYIKVDLPANYYFTKPMSDQYSDSNSDINDGNGVFTSNYIKLGVNDRHIDIDIGIYQFGSVGNFVWNDFNKNGIQNKFEYGIEDVHLSIYEKDGENELLSINSDVDGYYSFSSLLPGLYYIKVHDYDNEHFTIPNIGGSRNDSDINHEYGLGTTSLFQILSGIEKDDIDIGIVDNFNVKLNTYPNPVEDVLVLSYFGKQNENATIIIFNTDGNKVISNTFNSLEGENVKELNIKDLKFGFYNIVLLIDGKIADNNIILKVDSK